MKLRHSIFALPLALLLAFAHPWSARAGTLFNTTSGLESLTSVPATGTVALWVKTASSSGAVAFEMTGSGAYVAQWYIGSSVWSFFSNSVDVDMTGSTPTAWNFLAYSYTNNTASGGKLYYGAATTLGITNTNTVNTPNVATPDHFTVAKDGSFSGRIYCVKAWTVVLSQAELENEKKLCKPRRTTNLNRWIPLHNHASETIDWSGNALTMTASGTAISDTDDLPPITWSGQ